MDPNENVNQQWSLYRQARDYGGLSEIDREGLVELRKALFRWIDGGGFVPDADPPTRGMFAVVNVKLDA